jgi:Flp pilus assembly protein TadG
MTRLTTVPGRAREAFAAYARSYEDGITAAIFAVALLVLLGMVALGIDGGRIYDERRRAQNAADHAAIAAAFASCQAGSTFAQAQAAGVASALANGYDNVTNNTVTITESGGAGSHEYTARVDTRIGATFGQVIGFANLDTNGTATAQATGCEGGSGFGAVFSGGPCPPGKGLVLAGSNNIITGGLHTNGSLIHSGSNSQYGDDPPIAPPDPFTYVGPDSTWTLPTNYFESAPAQVGSRAWPTGWSPTDADALVTQYEAFVDDTSIPAAYRHKVSTPPTINADGVWFSTSTSTWTINSIPPGAQIVIVSRGPILIDMDHAEFSNFVHTELPREGVLILSSATHSPAAQGCDQFSISIPKLEVDWNGILWAPRGQVSISGSGMDATDTSRGEGAILSYSTKIEGQYVEVRFDPDLFPGEPDVLLLN